MCEKLEDKNEKLEEILLQTIIVKLFGHDDTLYLGWSVKPLTSLISIFELIFFQPKKRHKSKKEAIIIFYP